MSRVMDLVAEVERRFGKVVREAAPVLPVGELSDGELAHQVAAAACSCAPDSAVSEAAPPAEA